MRCSVKFWWFLAHNAQKWLNVYPTAPLKNVLAAMLRPRLSNGIKGLLPRPQNFQIGP
jgi:hypothetical protein